LYQYQKYITTLPSFDDPDIFGLNDNANIVYELKESSALLDLLSNILPKDKSSGKNSNEIVMEVINNMLAEQIEQIDKKARNKIHDKLYDNDLQHSLTIVLFQEIDKYNNLINVIDNSLNELKRAIEGTSVMSPESDEIFNSLLLNKIPSSWFKVGYTSFKSFGSWTNDLKKRIEFINKWLIEGHPAVYWMSGLFYPQGFITGVFQNHARETKIPVSDITMKYTVIDKSEDELVKGPKYGIYVSGLFLEGASWDSKNGLVDQKPGEMRCSMPVIWFETIKEVAKVSNDDDEPEDEIYYYSCPMFKTGRRAAIISSSGNSNEKVLEVDLMSKENKDYWTLRGAALLMQVDD
jgi:dynein heavy chain